MKTHGVTLLRNTMCFRQHLRTLATTGTSLQAMTRRRLFGKINIMCMSRTSEDGDLSRKVVPHPPPTSLVFAAPHTQMPVMASLLRIRDIWVSLERYSLSRYRVVHQLPLVACASPKRKQYLPNQSLLDLTGKQSRDTNLMHARQSLILGSR